MDIVTSYRKFLNNQLKWVLEIYKLDCLSDETKQKLISYSQELKTIYEEKCAQLEKSKEQKKKDDLSRLQTERQKAVYLLRNEGIKICAIAVSLNVSERTILRDIKQIKQLLEAG